jgi:hypothetical protein
MVFPGNVLIVRMRTIKDVELDKTGIAGIEGHIYVECAVSRSLVMNIPVEGTMGVRISIVVVALQPWTEGRC